MTAYINGAQAFSGMDRESRSTFSMSDPKFFFFKDDRDANEEAPGKVALLRIHRTAIGAKEARTLFLHLSTQNW